MAKGYTLRIVIAMMFPLLIPQPQPQPVPHGQWANIDQFAANALGFGQNFAPPQVAAPQRAQDFPQGTPSSVMQTLMKQYLNRTPHGLPDPNEPHNPLPLGPPAGTVYNHALPHPMPSTYPHGPPVSVEIPITRTFEVPDREAPVKVVGVSNAHSFNVRGLRNKDRDYIKEHTEPGGFTELRNRDLVQRGHAARAEAINANRTRRNLPPLDPVVIEAMYNPEPVMYNPHPLPPGRMAGIRTADYNKSWLQKRYPNHHRIRDEDQTVNDRRQWDLYRSLKKKREREYSKLPMEYEPRDYSKLPMDYEPSGIADYTEPLLFEPLDPRSDLERARQTANNEYMMAEDLLEDLASDQTGYDNREGPVAFGPEANQQEYMRDLMDDVQQFLGEHGGTWNDDMRMWANNAALNSRAAAQAEYDHLQAQEGQQFAEALEDYDAMVEASNEVRLRGMRHLGRTKDQLDDDIQAIPGEPGYLSSADFYNKWGVNKNDAHSIVQEINAFNATASRDLMHEADQMLSNIQGMSEEELAFYNTQMNHMWAASLGDQGTRVNTLVEALDADRNTNLRAGQPTPTTRDFYDLTIDAPIDPAIDQGPPDTWLEAIENAESYTDILTIDHELRNSNLPITPAASELLRAKLESHQQAHAEATKHITAVRQQKIDEERALVASRHTAEAERAERADQQITQFEQYSRQAKLKHEMMKSLAKGEGKEEKPQAKTRSQVYQEVADVMNATKAAPKVSGQKMPSQPSAAPQAKTGGGLGHLDPNRKKKGKGKERKPTSEAVLENLKTFNQGMGAKLTASKASKALQDGPGPSTGSMPDSKGVTTVMKSIRFADTGGTLSQNQKALGTLSDQAAHNSLVKTGHMEQDLTKPHESIAENKAPNVK